MASAPNYEDVKDDRPPSIVQSPSIPYVSEIPGGLFPGRAILIKGSVLKSSSTTKRFVVELCCGLLVRGDHQDNKALHFNPRFDSSTSWFSEKADRQIVLNTLVNNRWGVEERYDNVFKEDQPFTLRILVLSEYFKIAVNGRHLCDYLYRIGISDVRTIYVNGNVNIDLIEYQGELPKELPPGTKPMPETIRKPKLPLTVSINGGLFVGSKVHITASPLMNAEIFCVNFMKDKEHLLHFRVDFPWQNQEAAVVRNSTYKGVWQKEERQMTQFPFNRGVTFDLIFIAGTSSFMIKINGEHFTNFEYRGEVLLKDVNKFELKGDLAVYMVKIGITGAAVMNKKDQETSRRISSQEGQQQEQYHEFERSF